MELLIGGQCTAAQSGREEDVTSPFDGAVAGSVPMAAATGLVDVLHGREPAAVANPEWRTAVHPGPAASPTGGAR